MAKVMCDQFTRKFRHYPSKILVNCLPKDAEVQ